MKTILITGGTSGVGRELAAHYQHQGWQVWTCGRNLKSLGELERLGVHTVPCDLTKTSERQALFRTVSEQTEGLDGLINNAAVQRSDRFAAGTEHLADVERELAVNLLAPISLGLLFADMLAARGGFVANISSGLARIPLGRSPVYAASKAGLSHYTNSVRYQVSPVRFIDILLPLVDTPMTQGRGRGKLSARLAALGVAQGIARGSGQVRIGKAALLPAVGWLLPGLLPWAFNRPGRQAR